MDSAVQSTKFINYTPTIDDTVINGLKEVDMKLVLEKKWALLRRDQRVASLSFTHRYKHWTLGPILLTLV